MNPFIIHQIKASIEVKQAILADAAMIGTIQQVAAAAKPFRRAFGLRTACVHGGSDRAKQAAALARGAHLLVATPGRLLDLMEAGDADFGECGWLGMVLGVGGRRGGG